jgi:hypothetical protein
MKYIGIDPGAKTGLAIMQGGVLIYLITTDFWGAIAQIKHDSNGELTVIIELPKNDHIHHKYDTPRSLGSIGVDVGRVMREAELLIEYCRRNGIEHKVVAPQGKIDHETFCRITGWKGQTNPHKRDAGMLIWGMR